MRNVLAIALALSSCSVLAVEPEDLRGLPLEQALEALRADGLAIIYSSDLVKPWMRVLSAPESGDPLEVLSEILAPLGLAFRPGPAGNVLIVRGREAASEADNPSAADVPDPGPELAIDTRQPRPIEEIIVAGSRFQLARTVGQSMVRLWSEHLEYMPDLGDDALRPVARLPGVGSDSVGAEPSMRGGETRETIVHFDGLRLHDPFHLQDFNNLFSAIDPRLVASMDVFTGGFPAAYGGVVSGIIDIASLTAPERRFHEVSVSLFNVSVLSSGTFANGSWVGSVRRSTLDLYHESSENYDGRPIYLNTYAKLAYRLSDSLQVTGNFLLFDDDVTVTHLDGHQHVHATGEDSYLWLRFDHSPGARWTGTTILARTRLGDERSGFSYLEGVSSGRLEDARVSRVFTVKSDWSATINERVLVHLGGLLGDMRGEYVYADEVAHDVLVDFPGAASTPAHSRDIRMYPDGAQYALYGSVRYAPGDRLAIEAGLRWDRQTLSRERPDTASPRVGLSYRLADGLFLKGSLGRFWQAQAIYELQLEDGVQRYFPPQRADHAVIGIENEFRSGLRLRLEAYRKQMSELRPRFENLLNPLTMFPELKPDRIRIAPDKAEARGFEVFVEKQARDNLTWWAGYSWSRFTDELGGHSTLRSWDRTHTLSSGLILDTALWNMSLGLIQHEGWPTTPVALDPSGHIVATGERNSERTGAYRSVDLRLTRKFQLPRSALAVFVEVTNMFDRANPYTREYEFRRHADGDELWLQALNSLPRVHSAGFTWTF